MTRIELSFLVNFLLFFCEVTMAQEPTLTVMPESIRKNLGESVLISCTANVEQPKLLTNMEWRGPGNNLIPNDDESITTLEGLAGPNQLEVLIEKLKREDAGIYTCSATYAGNQKLEKTIKVETYSDIDFKDTESVQTPKLHSDAKIRCVVTAEPAPLVDWLKDSVPIKDNKRIIQQNDGILIKGITEHDEGVYRCRARVQELGEIKYKDIQVEVHVPPEITGPPKDVEGVEKESASFQCIAKGKPAPIYTWVNKDSEVLNNKEGYFVNDQTGDFKVLDIRPDHAGTYRCTAKNQAGEAFAEATLRVLTKPKVEKFLNITVAAGDDAEMICEMTGDPLPDAVFQKESNSEPFLKGINEDGRIEVSQTEDRGRRIGSLRISGVERKDDGLYTCSGISSGGKTVMWGHITVEFQPTFEDQPINEFWSWEQRPVNLTCLATSIPNATIQWFLREDPIREEDPNLEVLSRGPAGVLKVHPVDHSYFDKYTCKATNTIGVASQEVVLKQVQKPGHVSSAQVEKKTATTVSWSIRDPLDDGGIDVLGFTVQYRPHNTNWDKAQEKFWPKGSSYVVDKLTPLATYVFRFAARNKVGDGVWSGEKSVEMPKRAVPEEPLIFGIRPKTIKQIPYPDHYDLQWQAPPDNGEPIEYYQIVYYQVHNATNGWGEIGPRETKTVESPGQTTYKLEGLKSDAYYRIELRAYNEIGFSTPSEAIIKTAYDPASSSDNQPGPSVKLSSVATSTPSNAPQKSVPEEDKGDKEDSNVGLIVAIVIIVILILLIILDVILFFAKNIGLTAFLVSKLGSKPSKDKEAMIEDGTKKNSKPDDNSNKEMDKVPTLESSKEKEVTESTPMITGESDKDAIKTEEKEREDEETKKGTAATNEALAKDSSV